MYRGETRLGDDAGPGAAAGGVLSSVQPTSLGDRYVVRDMIGAGGSATVYRARDSVSGSDVAVKLFHANLSPAARRRHQQELRMFRELRHPGLVTLYDTGTYQHRTYLVMSLIRGPALAEQ